jgi:hypothetical protein
MDFDCDSKVLDRMIVRMIENCYHVSVRDERSLNGIVFKNTNDGVELGMSFRHLFAKFKYKVVQKFVYIAIS